jgi:hypothetical protein
MTSFILCIKDFLTDVMKMRCLRYARYILYRRAVEYDKPGAITRRWLTPLYDEEGR